MDARQFQALLSPASWNGFAFHVAKEDSDAEHRISTEDIPHGGSVVEAFGPKLQKHNLDAYLTGTDAAGRAVALVAALSTGRPGVLVLPTGGARLARVLRVRRSFEKDKLGWLAVQIEAQDEPDNTGFTSTPNALVNEGFALLDQAETALTPAIAASLAAGPSGFRGVVLEGLIGSALAEIEHLAALAVALRLPHETRALVRDALETAVTAVTRLPVDPAPFTSALFRAATAMGASVALPVLLQEVEARAPRIENTGPFIGVIDPALAHNAAVLATTTESTVLIACIASALQTPFESRVTAVQARAAMAGFSHSVLSRHSATSLDLPDILSRATGLAGHLLHRIITDLAPVLSVSMPVSMPALWWSHRLYGRADRHLRLATLASAPHPGFMPSAFEAEAA